VQKGWVLNSWDRMVIPKPFSSATMYASSPIYVSPDANEEQISAYHVQMQAALEKCRENAERMAGLA
jgi:lysophospholipid acyltransferase (LPLAT)-like uncharacterized protein